MKAQRDTMSDLCFTIAEDYLSSRDYDYALSFFNESLRYSEGNKKVNRGIPRTSRCIVFLTCQKSSLAPRPPQSMLALAKLYIQKGDLAAAHDQCLALLRSDLANEEATIMIADGLFQKGEYDSAKFHYQQLLEKNPNHYAAMSRLIELLRRTGKIIEAPKILENAQNALKRADVDAGLHFVKGLYSK
jgi:tetratricopeptide repeat protein 21B